MNNKTKKGINKRKLVNFLICFFMVVIMIVCTLANVLMRYYRSTMNSVFGDRGVSISGSVDSMDTQYVKTTCTSEEEALEYAMDVTREVTQEGFVLLKNEDGTLPLKQSGDSKKITLFGVNSVNIVAGNRGTDLYIPEGERVSLEAGLEKAGFEVNPTTLSLYDHYFQSKDYVWSSSSEKNSSGTTTKDYYYKYGRQSGGFGSDSPWIIGELETEHYSDDYANELGVEASYAEYNDAAIVTITRVGGEGSDLAKDMGLYAEGSSANDGLGYGGNAGRHYLELDTTELEELEYVCSNFENVIVLINSSSVMELGFLNQDKYYDEVSDKTYDFTNIKSALWVGGVGTTGPDSIGSILSGEVTPSGHLADIYPADFTKDPTFANFGEYKYSNISADDTYIDDTYFTQYEEGIYIGYRYYETAEAEAKAGNYDGYEYDNAVVYPFGYGLSYADFEMSFEGTPVLNNGTFEFNVKVKNTSATYSGKAVAQIYYEAPYTAGGTEKSKVVLGDFTKTKLLAPGESTVVTMSIDQESMASYDYKNACAYVLDEGDYKFYLSEDSHSWASIDEKDSKKCFVQHLDGQVYSEVTNRFDDVSQMFSDTAEEGKAQNFSRADFAGTFPTAPEESDLLAADWIVAAVAKYDPANETDESEVMPVTDADNGVQLIQLRGLDADDPLYDEWVQQLSVDKMADILGNAMFSERAAIDEGMPYTEDCDGPYGYFSFFRFLTGGLTSNWYMTEVVTASTWNLELAEKFGDAIAEEGIQYGYTGWYGVGLNTHRSQFCGRNFEYFSEDGLLAGKIAAAAASGAEQKGMITFVKHFAVNEQELHRGDQSENGLLTWVNEQTLREIYLKPFEIYVKTAERTVNYYNEAGELVEKTMTGATGIMSSYNRLGTTWTGGSNALCEGVLRQEWGFDGVVVTDCGGGTDEHMSPDMAVRNGSDMMLSNTVYLDTSSATAVTAMQKAMKRLAYAKANSHAMNGFAPDSTMTETSAPWETGLMIGTVAAILVELALGYLLYRRKKQ